MVVVVLVGVELGRCAVFVVEIVAVLVFEVVGSVESGECKIMSVLITGTPFEVRVCS